jgi:serine/threonine protein kinase
MLLFFIHRCTDNAGIIHGDIKPQNVLIFKDDSDLYVAKIADFGYSNIFKENSRFAMPMTEPWEAPEWKKGYLFSFSEAQKMDAYSFGMLCLWLILYISLNNPEAIVGKFEDLGERNGGIYAAGTSLIESHASLQTLQKERLDKLFSLTLVNDPNCRSFNFNQFLSCLTTKT